jgi:hypothetical protein
MAVVILQPHGLGDHIFCMSLAHQIADRQEIIWPVLEHFISGLRTAYPDINWIPTGMLGPQIENYKRIGVLNGHTIVPIRWADQLTKVPYKDCMRSKYDLYGLDWNTWKDFTFKRNHDKEEELFYDVLKLQLDEPFRLINRRFTSLESKSVDIPESKEIRNIEMQSIQGFSLFDWSRVISRATEIHTVGTSINYIIELLNIQAENVVLYKRLPDENHYQNYDYILKRHQYIYT